MLIICGNNFLTNLPDREKWKNVMKKLDFIVTIDVLPACVETCPTGARMFGDLDDPESDVAKIVNSNKVFPIGAEYGTKPRVYYVRGEVKLC